MSMMIGENEYINIKVAADAKDRSFVAAPACVEAMDNIWYDKIDPYQTKISRGVARCLSFFSLGLLAPFIVSYRENEQVLLNS